jgi:hypothetical protein
MLQGMNACCVPPEPMGAMVYQIRVRGRLGSEWAEWFDGLTVSAAGEDDTLLTGLVADQAALYGVLRKVRNLGLPLLAVSCSACPNVDGTSLEPEERNSCAQS